MVTALHKLGKGGLVVGAASLTVPAMLDKLSGADPGAALSLLGSQLSLPAADQILCAYQP